MDKDKENEISLEQFKAVVKNYSSYFFSKWKLIVLVGFVSGLLGITYAWLQKPVYIAEITFAGETEGSPSLGGYAGIAAQFGFDLSGGGGAFEGDNLIELMYSRMLIEKTLLSPVDIDGGKQLLINYYIKKNKLDEAWKKDKNKLLHRVEFRGLNESPERSRDSILQRMIKDLKDNSLKISKNDKKLNFISAKMESEDEVFSKVFIEQLVKNVIQYYVEYKSKKSRQNVEILKHQADSVRGMLSGNIVDIAESNDLNVNPLRQVARTNVQRKQVDVQVNSAVYGELVKNLELSRVMLRKETPLIQIIDTPMLPLEKKKLGRLPGGIIFAFVGGCLVVFWLFIKKLLEL